MRNFRDLSYLGLKEGMICRSDVLYRLTFKEKRLLKKEHNIKIIIDLRRPKEAKKLKDSFMFFVKRYNISMVTNEAQIKEVKGLELPDMVFFYQDVVRMDKKPSWEKIFKLLLEDNNKGILFHCSAGKDRTGVICAVILTILGFDKETIYKDYLLTNDNPLYYKTIAEKMPPETKEVFLDHFMAKREYLDATFKEIDKVYGSFDNFLKECCCLDEIKINKLKQKYLK